MRACPSDHEEFKAACHHFIETYFPNEAGVFNVVWDAFWQATGCTTLKELSGTTIQLRAGIPIFDLGAMGDASCGPLDTIHALSALNSVGAVLATRQAHEQMGYTDVARVVEEELRRLKIVDHVRRVISKHSVDMFCSLFHVAARQGDGHEGMMAEQLDPEERLDGVSQASRRPVDAFWIELLSPGIVGVQGKWRSVDEASWSVSRADFDLVIDEPNGTLWSWDDRKQTPRPIGRVGPNLKLLLWMTLTHPGRTVTFLEFLQIIDGERDAELDESDRQRVYQYRNRLADILGTGVPVQRSRRKKTASENDQSHMRLIDRVLSKGDPMTYFVSMVGWSFCWIRREQNTKCSLLVSHFAKVLEPPKNQ